MNSAFGWVPNPYLNTEMGINTDSVFYLAAVQWQSEKPFLEFRVHGHQTSESEKANGLQMKFRIVADQQRRCIGTIERSKDGTISVQCDLPAVTARQCERCQTKDNIAAANMHQAHRRGRESINKAMAEYLTHPHRLYLAIFRDGSIKVGTTRGSSGGNRLVEQGAWYANYLAQVDDGFIVRELEDLLTQELGISQAVDTRKKFAGHLQPLENQYLDDRLDQLSNETQKILAKEIGNRGVLLGERWSNPRLEDLMWSDLVAYPAAINQGAHEFTIKSMVGRLAGCKRNGFEENFLLDLQPLVAHPLETGDFDVDEFVMQDSLF